MKPRRAPLALLLCGTSPTHHEALRRVAILEPETRAWNQRHFHAFFAHFSLIFGDFRLRTRRFEPFSPLLSRVEAVS